MDSNGIIWETNPDQPSACIRYVKYGVMITPMAYTSVTIWKPLEEVLKNDMAGEGA